MLKRLFIKDYKNVEDSNVRNKYGVVAGMFGIITNIILFVIKFIIGFFSNSITIMADAFNNLSDSFSSIITILGFKLSNKPADKEHPYGHARYEQLTAILISFIILAMGVLLAKSSIEKIITPEEISLTMATYLVLIVAVIGKFIQMFVYNDFAKAIDSKTIKANAIDSRNDAISTSAVLIAMVIMGVFKINLDAYMGFVVSVFIIISAWKTINEAISPVLGTTPTDEQVRKITQKIKSYEGVAGIHDLMIHNYGPGIDFVTVHVEIPSSIDILIAHDLMDNIEKDFREELNINLTIHMDPLDLENEHVTKLYKKVKQILKEFDEEVNFHDFRIVSGKSHTNMIFDVVVPFEKDYKEEDFQELLHEKLKDEEQQYYFVLTIERPFVNNIK